MRNIIIFGNTLENAWDKLNTLLDDISVNQISKFIDNGFILNNGDRYLAVEAKERKACKWQYAYIDREIENQFIEEIIFYAFTSKDNKQIEDCYEWFN